MQSRAEEPYRGTPQGRVLGRGLTTIIVVLVGLILSPWIAWHAYMAEARKIMKQIEGDLYERVEVLRRDLDVHLESLSSLKAVYHIFGELDRQQFAVFAAQAIERHPAIQAIEWIPRVPAERRAEYEARARSEGLTAFRITQRRSEGEMIPAEGRAEYFPVYFVEPLEGNVAALGFDLGSDPDRLEALEAARDSGEHRATGGITLVQERTGGYGFLVFLPIYNGSPESVEERRDRLQGFVLGVYRTEGILQRGMNPTEEASEHRPAIRLIDDTVPSEPHVLYSNDGDGQPSGIEYSWELGLVGGRQWRLEAIPSGRAVEDLRTIAPWLTLLVGLLLTGCLAGYLHSVAQKERRVREFAAHLQSARENERSHVAREIHDELGQVLTGLKFEISALGRATENVNPETRRRLDITGRMIDDTIGSVRQLATALRPQILDELGLLEAIRWQVREFEQHTGIACHLELPDEEIGWSSDRATAMFRMVQESLTNVARHAGATNVTVRVTQRPDHVELEVTDDGRGITEEERNDPRAFGLLGMRERAHMFGGVMRIQGRADEGTSVLVRMPR